MSTESLQDAIEELEIHAKAQGNGLLMEIALAARAELEAIRKAAKALARFYGGKERTDSERALALMESIAKEGP